jgi:4'-phosphopantetheinyl transferase
MAGRIDLRDQTSLAAAKLGDVSPNFLSPPEIERLHSMASPLRRATFAFGRQAVRQHAARVLMCEPAAVPLVVAPDGSLELAESGLFVSLSHTTDGDMVSAFSGLARVPIGVDLEMRRSRNPDLLTRILNADEQAIPELLQLSTDDTIVVCWAMKEAVLKARRSGFRCSAREIRLRPAEETAMFQADVRGEVWKVSFEIEKDLVMAVATRPDEL